MSHTVREKDQLLMRIKRIRGQLNATERAIEEERDCNDLLHMLTACRGAMGSLISEVLEGHIFEHVVVDDHGKHGKASAAQLKAARELMAAIKTYLK